MLQPDLDDLASTVSIPKMSHFEMRSGRDVIPKPLATDRNRAFEKMEAAEALKHSGFLNCRKFRDVAHALHFVCCVFWA